MASYKSKVAIAKKQISQAVIVGLTECAIVVHKQAVQNEIAVDTGRLRASLCYSVNGGGVQGQTSASDSESGDSDISSKDNTAVIGTNVNYAKYIEVNGGIDGRGKAFLSRCLDAKMLKRCEKMLSTEVEKALKL